MSSEEKLSDERQQRQQPEGTTVAVAEKCPVCLQLINPRRKSFASACFHSFCYECILEWSKIKHNCPLCKRAYDRIVYEVKSKYEYKEHYLKTSEELQQSATAAANQPQIQIIGFITSGGNGGAGLNINYQQQNQMENKAVQYSKASFLVNKEAATVEFRSLVYINGWYVSKSQVQSYLNISHVDLMNLDNDDADSSIEEEEAEENDEIHLLHVGGNQNHQNDDANRVKKQLIFIQYKLIDKFRLSSPKFFQNNQVALNRLMPFIHRELKALASIASPKYRLDQNKRYILAAKIIELVRSIEIDSEEFYNQIGPFVRPVRVARHFMHELNAFAQSSSVDLVEYDARCVYYEHDDYLKLITTNNTTAASTTTTSTTPLVSLPVNLNKYRIIEFNKSNNKIRPRFLSNSFSIFDSSSNNNYPIIRTNSNSHSNASNSESTSSRSADESPPPPSRTTTTATNVDYDSDHSSFCEELPVPPKKSPEYILVKSSSSDSSNSSDSSSSDSEAKVGEQKEQEEKPCTSKSILSSSNSISRRKSRHHKSKSKSKSKSKDKESAKSNSNQHQHHQHHHHHSHRHSHRHKKHQHSKSSSSSCSKKSPTDNTNNTQSQSPPPPPPSIIVDN